MWIFDIEQVISDCGNEGCPKFLGFDGWIIIWGKCWVSFLARRKDWICIV